MFFLAYPRLFISHLLLQHNESELPTTTNNLFLFFHLLSTFTLQSSLSPFSFSLFISPQLPITLVYPSGTRTSCQHSLLHPQHTPPQLLPTPSQRTRHRYAITFCILFVCVRVCAESRCLTVTTSLPQHYSTSTYCPSTIFYLSRFRAAPTTAGHGISKRCRERTGPRTYERKRECCS